MISEDNRLDSQNLASKNIIAALRVWRNADR